MTYQVIPYGFTELEREHITLPGGLGATETAKRGKVTTCGPEPHAKDRLNIQVCATRHNTHPMPVVGSSPDIARAFVNFVGRMNLDMQEHFAVVLLTSRHEILGFKIIAIGSLTHVAISLVEVLRPAVIIPTAAIVVCHNHPSGDPTPSATSR